LKNFNISTNNPISRVEVAKVLGHLLLGFLGFGTSGVWLACFVENKRRGEKKRKAQGWGENMGYT